MLDVVQLEKRREAEQARLDQIRPAKDRNRWGQFATPHSLARDIVSCAWELFQSSSAGPIRFLDPGVGTGSFYSAMLHVIPESQIASAVGVELDPCVAEVADQLWLTRGLSVIRGDFAAQPPQGPFNLIVSNPPYVRHHHIPGEQKNRLRSMVLQRLGIETSGLSGLYVHFLLLADAWLEDGGIGTWLVPSEFMDVNYGDALKRYLTDHVTLLRIHRFLPSDTQFADALVSSTVLIFQKRRPTSRHKVSVSCGGPISGPARTDQVEIARLRREPKWTPLIEGSITGGHRSVITLGDLFSIKRGVATGANQFFILRDEDVQRYGIPMEALKPILPSPRYLSSDIILADVNGSPRVSPRLHLIDTQWDEEQIRERFPGFWHYLEQGRDKGVHAAYLASRRSPWYSQERRPPAPFLCTYMGRSQDGRSPFRFIWNRSSATAHNVFLLLYPKPVLQAALNAHPSGYEQIFYALQQLSADEIVAGGRVYGGGLHKVEPGELARISAEPVLIALGDLKISRQESLFI